MVLRDKPENKVEVAEGLDDAVDAPVENVLGSLKDVVDGEAEPVLNDPEEDVVDSLEDVLAGVDFVFDDSEEILVVLDIIF